MCVHYLLGCSNMFRLHTVAICWILMRAVKNGAQETWPSGSASKYWNCFHGCAVSFHSLLMFLLWIPNLWTCSSLSLTTPLFGFLKTCHILLKTCHVLLVFSCPFFSLILLTCIPFILFILIFLLAGPFHVHLMSPWCPVCYIRLFCIVNVLHFNASTYSELCIDALS